MSKTEEFMAIRPGDVVAFTGGGGKSTLMFSIAHRLVKEGRKVLVTATRPFAPPPGETARVYVMEDHDPAHLRPWLGEHGLLVLTRARAGKGLLEAAPPRVIAKFVEIADYLFVETEDSGGEDVPLPGNPRLIPDGSTVLAAVAGLAGLGPALDCQGMATRLLDPEGPLLGPPGFTRRVLLLNQADRRSVYQDGARVVRALLAGWPEGTPRPQVLLTSVRDFLRPA